MQVGLGRLFGIGVAVVVAAAHQQRAVAYGAELAHMGRGIAYGIAHTRVRRAVGLRTVKEQHVVQRHFTRLQFDVDDPGGIDFHGDLLAAREQVVLVKAVLMRHLCVVR